MHLARTSSLGIAASGDGCAAKLLFQAERRACLIGFIASRGPHPGSSASSYGLLFSLPPLDAPGHLQRIFTLARQFVVEVETHPIKPEEYEFLAGG